jgi:hypothetical protein
MLDNDVVKIAEDRIQLEITEQSPVGRESEAHPAFSNWVKPESCRNTYAPLFQEVRSLLRLRGWNAAGNS